MGTEALLSAAPAPKAWHRSLRISSRVMEVTFHSRVLKLANVDFADQKRSSAEAGTPALFLPAHADPENSCSFEVLVSDEGLGAQRMLGCLQRETLEEWIM